MCLQYSEDEPLLASSTHGLRMGSSHASSVTPFRSRSASFMSQEEYLQTIASRVLYSRSCTAFYLSLLLASLTEIVWILHPWVNTRHCCRLSFPRSRVFFAVETYLTVGLFGETTLRILWQRSRFWLQCGNIFDASVCVLSVLSFVVYVENLSQDLEMVVLVLMGVWVALRLARLLTVAKNLHLRRRTIQPSLDIDFATSALSFPPGDEEEGLSPSHAASAGQGSTQPLRPQAPISSTEALN